MTSNSREKFTIRVNAKTLAAVRQVAEWEGRQLQSLIDEALTDLLEKRRLGQPRSHVLTTHERGHEQYGDLYKKLAQ
jgi:hypothetical protein